MANAENVRVSCSPISNEILLGWVTKNNPNLYREKRPATDEVIGAVVEYCMLDCPQGSILEIKNENSGWFRITVEPISESERLLYQTDIS